MKLLSKEYIDEILPDVEKFVEHLKDARLSSVFVFYAGHKQDDCGQIIATTEGVWLIGNLEKTKQTLINSVIDKETMILNAREAGHSKLS